MSWLLADVGCLECGSPTDHLGIFPTSEDVEAFIRSRHPAQRSGWEPTLIWLTFLEEGNDSGDWHGDHVFVAFEIPEHVQ